MIKKITVLIVLSLVCFSCKQKQENIIAKSDNDIFLDAHNYYENQMSLAVAYMDSLLLVDATDQNAKHYFKQARIAFKKAEPYASYLKPEVGHRANGPALPILTEDTQKILAPIGLQKIEESIYDGIDSEEAYARELNLTKGLLVVLRNYIQQRPITPQRFFIATHQQLMRIISLGISGFDTPVSQLGLEETTISLLSLMDVYEMTIQSIIKEKNSQLDSEFKEHISQAVEFIGTNPDFETFDRYIFIKDYMNPVTRDWVAIRKEANLWDATDNYPYNFDAPTFFETNSFNVNAFMPVSNKGASEKQVALGKKLFFDKNLSKDGKMACVTCHDPNKGWADGLSTNFDNDGKPLTRNSPTLINSAFQRSQFLDGRSPDLISQVSSVFNNEKEFNASVHQFSGDILIDSTYIDLFKEAYGGMSAKNTEIIKAISAYVATLNGFDSKFDKNIRGEEDSFTEQEKLGFNLFMGKALCATCHFVPLTNGTVPPFFAEHEKEVIGVPSRADNKMLDEDPGFYLINNDDFYKGMFKTPTVRNVELTAPYMHNGVYQTLEEVVNFYNLGGGAGLGFDLPNQTLPFDNLELSKEEERALVAFMKTLTDAPLEQVY